MTSALKFNNDYSVREEHCQIIEDFVRQQGIKTVLEFGPGRSTLAFARAGCEVWTAEYQDKWFQYYRKQFVSEPKIHVVQYENCRDIRIPEVDGLTFDFGFVDSPAGRDVIDDDPPRLNSCQYVQGRTSRFLLHDAQRSGEQATLLQLRSDQWQVHYPWAGTKCALVSDVQAGRGESFTASPWPRRTYDFSHWPELPKVSCQCITYGRPFLLDEAVESFLRQDYPGERELVILNDLPGHELFFDHPQVRVINLPYRMRTVGEKRNACVALCTGDIIFPWDDDDISLPHRISYSLQQMTNRSYFKPDRFWYWNNGVIRSRPKKAVAHAMGCWSRSFFDEVSGYPHVQSGQDTGLEDRMSDQRRVVETTSMENVSYIYRFPGTGSYHLSAHGHGNGYHESAAFVAGQKIPKISRIHPCWRQDYQQLVADAIQRFSQSDSDTSSGSNEEE